MKLRMKPRGDNPNDFWLVDMYEATAGKGTVTYSTRRKSWWTGKLKDDGCLCHGKFRNGSTFTRVKRGES